MDKGTEMLYSLYLPRYREPSDFKITSRRINRYPSIMQRIATAALVLLLLGLARPVHCSGVPSARKATTRSWTVVEAVRYALCHSPDAKIALHRIDAAQAAVRQARSAFYPRVSLNAEYGGTNNPMYSFGNILNHGTFTYSIDFNDPGVTDNLRLQAGLGYRLYNGGRDQAGLRAAEAGKQAEEQQRHAVLATLADQVVRSFYTIVQAEEIVASRKAAIKAIDASLAVARARYNAGDLLKADLLDIEVRRSAAHEQLIQANHGLELARRGFLNLLGLEAGSVAIDTSQQFPQEIPADQSGINRPEIQQIDAMISAAREQLKQARGGYRPTADLFASYQLDKGFVHDGEQGDSWMTGVRVNYNLYEGDRTRAAVARAEAELARLREMRHKLSLSIGLEIEQARLNLQQAEERLRVTANQVRLATESARLFQERFKEGVILASSLLDAQSRLTEAQVHASLAKAARLIAIADLRKAVGVAQFPQCSPTNAQ